MKKLLASALLLSVAAAAQAEPSPALQQQSFERDGRTYSYSVQKTGGRTRIVGRDDHGKRFNLIVSGSNVYGQYDQRSLRFRVKDPVEAPMQVVSR